MELLQEILSNPKKRQEIILRELNDLLLKESYTEFKDGHRHSVYYTGEIKDNNLIYHRIETVDYRIVNQEDVIIESINDKLLHLLTDPLDKLEKLLFYLEDEQISLDESDIKLKQARFKKPFVRVMDSEILKEVFKLGFKGFQSSSTTGIKSLEFDEDGKEYKITTDDNFESPLRQNPKYNRLFQLLDTRNNYTSYSKEEVDDYEKDLQYSLDEAMPKEIHSIVKGYLPPYSR